MVAAVSACGGSDNEAAGGAGGTAGGGAAGGAGGAAGAGGSAPALVDPSAETQAVGADMQGYTAWPKFAGHETIAASMSHANMVVIRTTTTS